MSDEDTQTMSKDVAEPKPANTPALLVVQCDPGPGIDLVLRHRSQLVGREPGPGGLVLSHNAVSRVHASIQVSERTAVIRDMGSRNGVWVNGTRVEQAELHAGDDVRLGDGLYVFADDLPACQEPSDAAWLTFVGNASRRQLIQDCTAAVAAQGAILVHGETGVGKELVSESLHRLARRTGRMVAVNCAALSPSLVESELFGFEKGAFTGATRPHLGLIRDADHGTFLLDEIGDLPLEAQAKLLRVLETRMVTPVGSTKPTRVDIQVVSATHRDLQEAVRKGSFRADLYARIASSTIKIAPLRERKADLSLLIRDLCRRLGRLDIRCSIGFTARLLRHNFPLNVRELFALVQRAIVVMGSETELRALHLPPDFGEQPPARLPTPPSPQSEATRRVTVQAKRPRPPKEVLQALFERYEGNVAAVGRELGREPAQIYRWIEMYGLDLSAFRKA
jgi:transcriptional regulator with PAS, ATPase and Fis domain